MKTTFISLLLLSITFISCTTSTSTSTSTSTKTTTRTINSGTLRYNETITDEQATALGDYLVKEEFFDGNPIAVQVGKVDGVIHFAMELNDKDAYSEEYQTLGKVMIDELEQKVFKGSKVELDWCDENFKVKKNVKGYSDKVAATDVTTVSMPDALTANASLLPHKHWYCDDITGGTPKEAVQAAKELEIIKKQFYFDFEETGTFGSWFMNQADPENPVEIQGDYTVKGNIITFNSLTIGGQPSDQQMQFGFSATVDMFQLTSKEAGQPDLVITFKHD